MTWEKNICAISGMERPRYFLHRVGCSKGLNLTLMGMVFCLQGEIIAP